MRKSAGIPDSMAALVVLVVGYPEKRTDAVSKASTRNDKGAVTLLK